MSRLVKCINFQLKSMVKSTIIFLCIYFAAYLVILSLVAVSIGPGSSGSANAGFYIGGAIFVFIYVIADYKESFNYLMMLGNTRKNIFFASTARSVVMSLLLAAISIISLFVDSAAAEAFHFSGSGGSSLVSLMYGSSNKASEFLWFTTLFIMICSFSMLYGSLAYKLGKVFITVFWVCFGLSWMVLPALAGIDGANTLVAALKAYFCIASENGILLAPVNFIITAVIFSGAAYALSSRQSQVA